MSRPISTGRTDDRPQAVGGYSQTLTQAVDYVHANAAVDVFYFNDPTVKGVQLSRGRRPLAPVFEIK